MMALTRRRNARGATFLAPIFLAPIFLALILTLAPNILSGSKLLWAQESAEVHRKVVSRIAALYPSLARSRNIRGNVRVEALVAPNGTVKTAEVKGGHPLLAQSALYAVRMWKWEPAAHETHELVEIQFNPE